MTTPRIYVACLASYNAGLLHGRWIDLDGDADEVHAEIAAMLRESPYPSVTVDCPTCNLPATPAGLLAFGRVCPTCKGRGVVPSAEEWAVHDYDGIPSSFGEHPDIDELVRYAELAEEHGEAFRLWYSNADSTVELDEDAFLEAYRGAYSSLGDWAEEFLDEVGYFQGSADGIRNYFDFDRYGRDCELGGDIWTAEGADGLVYVFDNH